MGRGLTGLGVFKSKASLWRDAKAPCSFEERVRSGLPVDVILGTHNGVEKVRDLDGLEGFLHDVPVAAACDRQRLGAVVEARDCHNLVNGGDLFAQFEKNGLFVPDKRLHLQAQAVSLV